MHVSPQPSPSSPAQDEVMETQKSLLEVLEKRLDTNEEHIALLQSNDNEQDAKILGLEKADKFLQDTYAEGAKKTDQIEETATAQKHELEKLKGELDELSESCTNCEETIGKAIEEQASLSGLVEDIKEKIDTEKAEIENQVGSFTRLSLFTFKHRHFWGILITLGF